MQSRGNLKRAIAGVVVGVLIGGGVTAVSPAGAEVSQFAATNWKKIWKKKLQSHADKRYYTKAASDAKYTAAGAAYSKAEVDAKLGGYYTKAQADAKYQPVGSYAAAGSSYTKAEGDARYARSTGLVRGSFMILLSATAANEAAGTDISFGTTFETAPVVHLIPPGGVAPAGCSGTAAAPDASPGHLCVFGSLVDNGIPLSSCKVSNAVCFGTASDPWGASIFTRSVAAGLVQMFGTWAARPTGVVTTAPGLAKSGEGSINQVGPSTGVR